MKERGRTQGQATNCPGLGGEAVGDLETCKTRARMAHANAFNYGIYSGSTHCFYKSCADPGNLQLTTQHGGYNVYVIKCEANGECIL